MEDGQELPCGSSASTSECSLASMLGDESPTGDRKSAFVMRASSVEEDEPASPDCSITSVSSPTKKDKTCLVCGDKALGYNFNAVSCESCKAFFRRNAHKTIRGRCEGKCDVNMESRSFCKKCRLGKCFSVGMRKDMILNDEQKQMRKQKIIINKLRKQGQLPPEDTYAASPRDLTDSFKDSLKSQTFHSIRESFPNLSDKDVSTLMQLKSGAKPGSRDSAETIQYPSWAESQEAVADVISELPEIDQCILNEVRVAHEESAFLTTTQTQLKQAPTNPTEFVNVAEGFVRRIIKVAKNIEFFKMVCKEDQIALLKGAVVEIIMLRSAINYDIQTETWSLNTMKCLTRGTGSSSASSSGSHSSSPASFSGSSAQSPSSTVTSPPPVQSRDQLLEMVQKSGMNTDAFKAMARNKGIDIEKLREMRKNSNLDSDVKRMMMKNSHYMVRVDKDTEKNEEIKREQTPEDCSAPMVDKIRSVMKESGQDIEALRNMARSAGLDVDKLREMFTGGGGDGGREGGASESGEFDGKISADILKGGTAETATMFLTYTKFVKSLMRTIHGDLLILKLLIMLSLFSADRSGIKERDKIQEIQECYAGILQKYAQRRFPDDKNMFARIIMKLTDLRNINEVHTKMLLKMKLDNIEPLLLEIFDLQT